jgi:serine/threonine protein kinase
MPPTALALKDADLPQEHANALAVGTMLHEYCLERVLGSGGFGITYLGKDTHLDKYVAIKEYLPAQLAVRALDGSVIPVATEQKYDYAWGLERFVAEARTLARFSHPHIVRVNRYIELNGTAYMVMDYEAGVSLSKWLADNPGVDEATLKRVAEPILEGLSAVHAEGFLHRDIKPANIYVRADGSPVLIDFGAARQAIGQRSMSLTSIVSPGYAPIEQYASDGNQGPWTDIYSLSAVFFRAVTGANPPDAISRLRLDRVPARLSAVATRYSKAFIGAIELGMALNERSRPQSVAEWREVLALTDATTHRSSEPRPPVLTTATPVRSVAKESGSPLTPLPSTVRASAQMPPLLPIPPAQPTDRGWRWAVLAVSAVGVFFAGAHSMRPTPPSTGQPSAPQALQTPVVAAPAGPAESAPPRVAHVGREPNHAVGQLAPAADARAEQAPRRPPPPIQESRQEPFAAPPKGKPLPLSATLEREFAQIDMDGDGMISLAEARERLPKLARDFEWADANRDGRISLPELQRFRRAGR